MTRAWVILTVAALAGWAGAAIPGAEDPKATTRHDELRARLDYNRRTMAEAYKKVGFRDPRWDAASLAYLDATAIEFTYRDANRAYQPAGLRTREQLFELARAAFMTRVEDPLVKYCLLLTMFERGQYAEAVGDMETTTAELIDRKYPSIRVAAAAERTVEALTKSNNKDAARIRKADQIAWDYTLATLAGPVPDADLREVLHQCVGYFLDLPRARQGAFCDAMAAKKGVDPWLVAMFRGIWERKTAWDDRGGDWAVNVTEAGWKGFHVHMAKAREQFVRAHGLHPEFPEAATEMIAIAMGGGDELKEKPREWFDKAAEAQFDFPEAYDNYVWSIYPRWGGSLREMLAFGEECLATNRYDTAVPDQFRRILHDVDEDSTNDMAVFRLARHKTALEVMFTRQAERAPDVALKDFYRSRHLAYALRLGDFESAGRLLDNLGEGAQEEPLKKLGGWPQLARSEIRAMNTAEGKALQAAGEAAERGEVGRAIELYRQAAVKLGDDHPGRLFARFRAKSLELQRDFDKGGWVSLKPEEDFVPWFPFAGDWRQDEAGVMTGVSEGYGMAFLVCRHNFGADYEVRATLESADGPATSAPPISVFVEWDVAWDGAGHWASFGVDGKRKVAFGGGYSTRQEKPLSEVRGTYLASARVNDGRMSVDVDGKPVIDGVKVDMIKDRSRSFVALGMYGAPRQRAARFKDVEIRRLAP